MANVEKKLCFGLMRLPTVDGNTEHIDTEQVCRMVDIFMQSGYTYFDTSYVYHNGMSEPAVRAALVERYPRGSFCLASKLPTFAITEEAQVEAIFNDSLAKAGVDYFDYYLLHNINESRYDGIIASCHMFDYMRRWKEEGRIRHIGFSFHDSAEVLDRVLTEHPEVEFVQIALNYLDWEHASVQARRCYETIRRHGRQVVVMEAVKGGTLASLPSEVESLLREAAPGRSAVDWSLLFGASLDGVLAVLSGMSSVEQMEQNARCLADFTPLTEGELALLAEAARMLDAKMKFALTEPEKFEGVCPEGIPVPELLRYYNEAMQEVFPPFSSELNYYSNLRDRSRPVSGCTHCGRCAGIMPGRDVPAALKEADSWFREHAFF